MGFYELTIIFCTLLYAFGGRMLSNVYKDPDMKTFSFIFWPLLVVYYLLFWVTSFTRRILVRILRYLFGGNTQNGSDK